MCSNHRCKHMELDRKAYTRALAIWRFLNENESKRFPIAEEIVQAVVRVCQNIALVSMLTWLFFD
jgi:hypothetical protein